MLKSKWAVRALSTAMLASLAVVPLQASAQHVASLAALSPRSSARHATSQVKKNTHPQNYTCVVNIPVGANPCAAPITLLANGLQPVFQLTLDVTTTGYSKAMFCVTYGLTPTAWTVDIGDSPTNDGYGGDYGSNSNAGEFDVVNNTMDVYPTYTNPGTGGITAIHLADAQNMSIRGRTTAYIVADGRLSWNPPAKVCPAVPASTYLSNTVFGYNTQDLYALNGEPDSYHSGTPNWDIFASFNRVINGTYRSGSGVTRVTITLIP